MYKSQSALIKCFNVQLHGWDPKTESWNGPIPVTGRSPGSRSILAKIRTTRNAFQGKLRCSVPGLPSIEFYTSVYDLGDSGLAIVHMDGSHAGPVGILTVVPRSRRRILRDDFAFELSTLISFLGSPVNRGCELTIHDYMDEALRADPSATHLFAVETAQTDSDTGIVLSAHFENLAAAMLEWLDERESQDDAIPGAGEGRNCTTVPGSCLPTAIPARCSAA